MTGIRPRLGEWALVPRRGGIGDSVNPIGMWNGEATVVRGVQATTYAELLRAGRRFWG